MGCAYMRTASVIASQWHTRHGHPGLFYWCASPLSGKTMQMLSRAGIVATKRGAMMILFNVRPRLGGWLLIIFLLPVTIVVHGYEMLNAQDEVIRALQQAHFLKGFALIGAALLITQTGVSQQNPNNK